MGFASGSVVPLCWVLAASGLLSSVGAWYGPLLYWSLASWALGPLDFWGFFFAPAQVLDGWLGGTPGRPWSPLSFSEVLMCDVGLLSRESCSLSSCFFSFLQVAFFLPPRGMQLFPH